MLSRSIIRIATLIWSIASAKAAVLVHLLLMFTLFSLLLTKYVSVGKFYLLLPVIYHNHYTLVFLYFMDLSNKGLLLILSLNHMHVLLSFCSNRCLVYDNFILWFWLYLLTIYYLLWLYTESFNLLHILTIFDLIFCHKAFTYDFLILL